MPITNPRPHEQRWLLLFNCQAPGLANCFSLLSRDVHVENHDTVTLGPNRDALLKRLDSYDRILVAPGIEKLFELDLGERANVWRLPPVMFAGFHPDACILAQEGELPSCEIITGACNGSAYYEADCRSISAPGVEHALRCFVAGYLAGGAHPVPATVGNAPDAWADVACDEAAMDRIRDLGAA
jgi:hypothetical protein